MNSLLQVAAGSRRGHARTANQDIVRAEEDPGVWVVVDGMGDDGAEAARVALEAVVAVAGSDPEKLGAAMRSAHDAVRALGSSKPERDRAAGATLVAAIIDPTLKLHVAHVGGARAYVRRQVDHPLPAPPAPRLAPPVGLPNGAELRCLTRDHTAVCELVERGHLSASQARKHPLRGRLKRALGSEKAPEPELISVTLFPTDVVLLGSDGLFEAIDDETLAKVLSSDADAPGLVDKVLEAAGECRDDASVIVIRVGTTAEKRGRADRKSNADDDDREADRDADRDDGENASPLARYGRDLMAAAAAGKLDPVIGRRGEILAVARAIVARRKPNALLVGPAGVGKTSIVEGLAQMIFDGDVAPQLRDLRIFEISISAMVAGTKYRGEFEARMRKLVKQTEEDPGLVLFIDEIHTVMGAGGRGGGAGDAAQILKPALARGSIRVIGATTTPEYQRHIASDEAFARRFSLVRVEEPSDEDTLAILRAIRPKLESHYGVSVDDDALVAAVRLSSRYVHDRYHPDKAIELVDRACAGLVIPLSGRARERLTRQDVVRLLARRCGVDEGLMAADLGEARERMQGLHDFLRARVLGQADSVEQVSTTLVRAYAGLKDPDRPVASMLFVGPTGVGKTETAKVLSEFLFGDRDRLLRIDMSEYRERHTVSRLIGAPPGYVGHDNEGQLTGPMHMLPQRVVLLDEIEKAHPDVLLLLLQMLDEGTLTDSHGRVASFRESVIILTSNLIGDGRKRRRLGFRAAAEEHAAEGDDDAVRAELTETLPPELVGRIGEVVQFDRLDLEAARAITELVADKMLARLREQGAEMTMPPGLVDRVVARVGNLELGARVIQRLVSEELGKQLMQPSKLAPQLPSVHARQRLTVLAIQPADASELERLAVCVRTGVGAADLHAVYKRDARLFVVVSSVARAIHMAREVLDESAGLCAVHRGAVRIDEGSARGMAVHLTEMVLEVLHERGDHRQIVLTGAAADALEGQAPSLRRLALDPAHAGPLGALELFTLALDPPQEAK